MPRILPRLLNTIEQQSTLHKNYPYDPRHPRRRPKSLYKPVPTWPSLNPKDYGKSILLAENNPITNSAKYTRHKTLPPQRKINKTRRSKAGEYDQPRQMTQEERRWWASPYLRMLASPIRACIVTGRYLPSDLLIRFSPVVLPSLHKGNPQTTLIPDGIQHTKFIARTSGKACYLVCAKSAVQEMMDRVSYKRFVNTNLVHPRLSEHISHLLRLRVLQELELLADHLEGQPRHLFPSSHSGPVIRRLTRKELQTIQNEGVIPQQSALAVLIVPPVNRDTLTGKRPEPNTSSLPPPTPTDPSEALAAIRPLSVLYPTRKTTGDEIQPQPSVPLYHGTAVFPDVGQRAALHKNLCRLLNVESRFKPPRFKGETQAGSSTEEKASHAFLLSSDESIVERADIAPVALALWRIRMFEGQ